MPYESWASSEHVARSMRSNRSRDTSFELAVRRELHRYGYRYRVDFAPLDSLRRRADIVFTRPRVAVFLDGCFWHGCPQHYKAPIANQSFWAQKIARNVERDAETNALLREAGWIVLRFWEHDPVAEVIEVIRSALPPRASRSDSG